MELWSYGVEENVNTRFGQTISGVGQNLILCRSLLLSGLVVCHHGEKRTANGELRKANREQQVNAARKVNSSEINNSRRTCSGILHSCQMLTFRIYFLPFCFFFLLKFCRLSISLLRRPFSFLFQQNGCRIPTCVKLQNRVHSLSFPPRSNRKQSQ